jgi:ketosteroid isomerase-like protein
MSDTSTSAADLEAIRATVDNWVSAANAGDSDVVLAGLTQDLEILPPGEIPRKGNEARQHYGGIMEEFNVALSMSEEGVAVGGDWGYYRYVFQMKLTPKAGGDPLTDNGHGIYIYRRQADGTWKLAKDIWSSLAPASDQS